MATPDGISQHDWEEVKTDARAVVDAASTDDDALYVRAVSVLMDRLRMLQRHYGPLPSILATMADYTDDAAEAIHLLEDAYSLAEQRNDAKNMTFIASSIAQRYVEDLGDIKAGKKWTEILRRCLRVFPDAGESAVLAELEERLERAT